MSETTLKPALKLPRCVGLALVPVPTRVLEVALQTVLDAVLRRHPNLPDRLGRFRPICIRPDDLPFVIVIEPGRKTLTMRVLRKHAPCAAPTQISGPFLALLGLVGGAYDGDALFFSREIAVVGDIECALALRNAIDDAQIDLWEAASAWSGPCAGVLQRVGRLSLRHGMHVLSRWQASAG